MGLKSRLLLLSFRVFKAVDPPELPFDILPGEVGIGAKHLGMDRPPHDQLDHTLRDPLLDHVGDPGVPEEMGSQALLDPGTFPNDPELGDGRLVPEERSPVVDEDRCVSFRSPGIVQPPLYDILHSCDDRDVPRDVCLEIHVHHDPVLVEGEVLPLHGPGLADAEASFIDEGDHGPVVAPVACLVETLNLLRSYQLGRGLGHRVVRRDLDPHHLLFGKRGELVFHQPNKELFQDPDEIMLGVLSERSALRSISILQGLDAVVNIGNGHPAELGEEPAPVHKGVCDLVHPGQADTSRDFLFSDELADQSNVVLRYPAFFQSILDGFVCEFRPHARELRMVLNQCGRFCHKRASERMYINFG